MLLKPEKKRKPGRKWNQVLKNTNAKLAESVNRLTRGREARGSIETEQLSVGCAKVTIKW